MRKKAAGGRMGFYLILLLIGVCIWIWINNSNDDISETYTIDEFKAQVSENLIDTVEIAQNKEVPTGYVRITYKADDEQLTFYVSDVNAVQEIVMDEGNGKISMSLYDVPQENTFLTYLPIILLVVVAVVVIVMLLSASSGGSSGAGGGRNVMSFAKSRAKMTNGEDQKTTFKDVAGLEEEKEDMEELVEFLKEPDKFNKMGARIPKGVLLEGPPGTGKTLIAKAVAGEAGVPFFTISGSDFVEMFVGVGASRVRDLFEDAKKNSPCIIFIDEIDAVARRRGSGLGGGHDEREQTLNQLLVEMDGFGSNEGIIVLAATNRVDILDPAILRPGRFDRKIMVGRPDVKGREEILRVHIKNKPLAEDVDLEEIARTTSGFSGADLENLMNEAAILAAKQNRSFITKADVDKCFVKIGIGGEKKSRLVPDTEKRITAYHESGHAILYHMLDEVGPVHIVSIIPNGRGAGGYTMPLPENDNVFVTRKKMLQEIMVAYGGRIAEEIILGNYTTGASSDIKQATKTALSMVVKYGMSEKLGCINYESEDQEEVFLGRDLGHSKSYSEKTAALIDKEVRRIMNECYLEARKIIEANMDVLHRSAALLLEKERINGQEFASLFGDNTEESDNNIDSGVIVQPGEDVEV